VLHDVRVEYPGLPGESFERREVAVLFPVMVGRDQGADKEGVAE
jgi:hypothetical protein